MKKPHILHATSPHRDGVRIECPGVDAGGCLVLVEVDECQCTDPECMCRPTTEEPEPDHWGCGHFDDYAPSLGAASCHLKRVDGCGAIDWFSGVGMDMIADFDWPGESPWEAEVRWDSHGEYMELVPWKGEA